MIRVLFVGILFKTIFCQLGTPDLFQYNQGTFQAFYFFKTVTIDSIKIDEDDWVGSFNCIQWDADSTSCIKLEMVPSILLHHWQELKMQ